MIERFRPIPAEQYDPHEAGLDESLVRDVLEEIPRFLREVKSEDRKLPSRQAFVEARNRAFRYLRVPGELWGAYAAVVAKMRAEKAKEQPRRPAVVSKKTSVFGNRTTESLIKESLAVMRARGGDPDDLDD